MDQGTVTDLVSSLPLSIAALACGVALFAGFIKGAVGFAMPMLMISGLGSFLAPELALAGLILPTVVSNVWQSLRQGPRAAAASAGLHWRYLVILFVMILVTAQFVTHLPTSVFLLLLGGPVVFFALLQLAGWKPRIVEATRRRAELVAGLVAGSFGGLAGVWGPPTVLYLTSLDTPKTEQVRVQGVIYGVGGVVLMLAHLNSGILNRETAVFSALLCIPAVIGMVAGFAVQDRLDQQRFRRITLIVLVLAGLNLVRRGLAL